MKHKKGQSYFDFKDFGKKIKNKRTVELNVGVRGASELIGINFTTVSRIEHGNVVDLENVLKGCDWLNQPITDFIKRKK
jgi:hypothetical protein